MNAIRPIFWHQGLFLQPQHFQYSDQRRGWEANFLRQSLAPYHWGVVDLAIDTGRLQANVLELTAATVLLRDGTLVSIPTAAVVPPRDLRDALTERRQPLTVYLGVRRLGQDANVTLVPNLAAAAAAETRYAALAEGEAVADLYQGGSAAPLKTLYCVAHLFWEDELEQAEHYELLPIARLVKDGNLAQLDPDYAPPTLRLAASPALMRVVKELRDELIGRGHQLEQYKSDGSSLLGEFSVKTMRYRLALQMVCRYAPLLTHLAETPTLHPWEIYGVLRQLVGEISAFSLNADLLGNLAGGATGLPAYDHLDAGSCFCAAQALAERLLNEITLGPDTFVELQAVHTGRYEAEIARDFLDSRGSLYLVLRSERPFEELIDGFQKFAKLGATGHVDVYRARALPGLTLHYLKARPESLPQRPNASYFRVNRQESAWESVVAERTLALVWDDAPADLRVDLVMVRG